MKKITVCIFAAGVLAGCGEAYKESIAQLKAEQVARILNEPLCPKRNPPNWVRRSPY